MDLHNFNGNDQVNVRFYSLENGNKLNLKRTDPYGFIYISLERGQLPEWLQGAYTDWAHARLAAEKYIKERQQAVAEIQTEDNAKKKK